MNMGKAGKLYGAIQGGIKGGQVGGPWGAVSGALLGLVGANSNDDDENSPLNLDENDIMNSKNFINGIGGTNGY